MRDHRRAVSRDPSWATGARKGGKSVSAQALGNLRTGRPFSLLQFRALSRGIGAGHGIDIEALDFPVGAWPPGSGWIWISGAGLERTAPNSVLAVQRLSQDSWRLRQLYQAGGAAALATELHGKAEAIGATDPGLPRLMKDAAAQIAASNDPDLTRIMARCISTP